MSGMEMMLARMIGMKPEEMREKANEMTAAFTEAADALKIMRSQLIDITERLERMENAQIQISLAGNGDDEPLRHRSGGIGNSRKRSTTTGTGDIQL